MRAGLLRALCFHQAWGYPPTVIELLTSWDRGTQEDTPVPTMVELNQILTRLIEERRVILFRGRVVFFGQEGLVLEHEKREALFPRKLRRAQRVAWWLSRVAGVRFVAICNTTALAHARDEGDLDFCIVTKAGSLWQTRGWATLPFKVANMRPGAATGDRDAVCLSFLFDDTALDLTALMLTPTDPYFRHWFLSLLPLVDDGIGSELWKVNTAITGRHPLSLPWLSHLDLVYGIPAIRIPWFLFLERLAQRVQRWVLPDVVRQQANQSTHVVITDHVLKMHVTDNRRIFREKYIECCLVYGVEP